MIRHPMKVPGGQKIRSHLESAKDCAGRDIDTISVALRN